MTPETFLDSFGHLLDAPSGIAKLRELILQLAVQGKLVEQDSSDEPAQTLLENIKSIREDLVARKIIKREQELPEFDVGELPYSLAQSWCWVRLMDVCEYIQRGKGPSYVESSRVPVVSQKCIQWSGFTLEPARFIDPNS
jgi:type I restriction enzyme S subunit